MIDDERLAVCRPGLSSGRSSDRLPIRGAVGQSGAIGDGFGRSHQTRVGLPFHAFRLVCPALARQPEDRSLFDAKRLKQHLGVRTRRAGAPSHIFRRSVHGFARVVADGNRLVLTSHANGSREVFLMDPRTQDIRQLTHAASDEKGRAMLLAATAIGSRTVERFHGLAMRSGRWPPRVVTRARSPAPEPSKHLSPRMERSCTSPRNVRSLVSGVCL